MTGLRAGGERIVRAVLADMSDLPHFRVDADHTVIEVSPAMERLTGFRARDVLGHSCLELHRCQECLAGCGVFELGAVRSKALRLYRADGTTVAVAKSGRAVVDEHGAVIGAIEVVRPIEGRAAAGASDEATRIRRALERSRYHRADAARSLGISRTTLWRKMKEHGF